MNKSRVYFAVSFLIFLLVFNIIFFIVGGTEHVPAVWLSYAFIHIAYLIMILIPIMENKTESAAIFGGSFYLYWLFYFITEFVVGLIFIIVSPEKITLALILQVIIIGAYLSLLFIMKAGNESIAMKEKQNKSNNEYFNKTTMEIKLLFDRTENNEVTRLVEYLYDNLRSSPAKSFSNTEEIEMEIQLKIKNLGPVLNNVQLSEEKIKELDMLIKKRNIMVRQNY